MRTQQCGIVQLAGLLHACCGQCQRIAIDCIKALVAGGGGEQQHYFIGGVDAQAVTHPAERAALDLRQHAQGKTQLAVDAGEAAVAAAEQQPALLHRDRAGLRAVDAHAQGNRAWPIAGQAHHDALRLRRHEHFALVHSTAGAERGGGDAGIQIELAAILADAVGTIKIQQQIAQRLIRHLLERTREHLGVGQGFGFGIAPGKHERAHLWQGRQRVGAGGIVRATCVQRVLVELQALVGNAAPHHRAQPAVADRQRLHPLVGRFAVPQLQGIARSNGRQRLLAGSLGRRSNGGRSRRSAQRRECGTGCLADFPAGQHVHHRAA